ncbi:MAG: hypothetical protein FWD52_06985 [Candidatus Bathyarchaeota archaeon]|nr:hypothetical protein [Candidatus Termiticorpusculum sp.]
MTNTNTTTNNNSNSNSDNSDSPEFVIHLISRSTKKPMILLPIEPTITPDTLFNTFQLPPNYEQQQLYTETPYFQTNPVQNPNNNTIPNNTPNETSPQTTQNPLKNQNNNLNLQKQTNSPKKIAANHNLLTDEKIEPTMSNETIASSSFLSGTLDAMVDTPSVVAERHFKTALQSNAGIQPISSSERVEVSEEQEVNDDDNNSSGGGLVGVKGTSVFSDEVVGASLSESLKTVSSDQRTVEKVSFKPILPDSESVQIDPSAVVVDVDDIKNDDDNVVDGSMRLLSNDKSVVIDNMVIRDSMSEVKSVSPSFERVEGDDLEFERQTDISKQQIVNKNSSSNSNSNSNSGGLVGAKVESALIGEMVAPSFLSDALKTVSNNQTIAEKTESFKPILQDNAGVQQVFSSDAVVNVEDNKTANVDGIVPLLSNVSRVVMDNNVEAASGSQVKPFSSDLEVEESDLRVEGQVDLSKIQITSANLINTTVESTLSDDVERSFLTETPKITLIDQNVIVTQPYREIIVPDSANTPHTSNEVVDVKKNIPNNSLNLSTNEPNISLHSTPNKLQTLPNPKSSKKTNTQTHNLTPQKQTKPSSMTQTIPLNEETKVNNQRTKDNSSTIVKITPNSINTSTTSKTVENKNISTHSSPPTNKQNLPVKPTKTLQPPPNDDASSFSKRSPSFVYQPKTQKNKDNDKKLDTDKTEKQTLNTTTVNTPTPTTTTTIKEENIIADNILPIVKPVESEMHSTNKTTLQPSIDNIENQPNYYPNLKNNTTTTAITQPPLESSPTTDFKKDFETSSNLENKQDPLNLNTNNNITQQPTNQTSLTPKTQNNPQNITPNTTQPPTPITPNNNPYPTTTPEKTITTTTPIAITPNENLPNNPTKNYTPSHPENTVETNTNTNNDTTTDAADYEYSSENTLQPTNPIHQPSFPPPSSSSLLFTPKPTPQTTTITPITPVIENTPYANSNNDNISNNPRSSGNRFVKTKSPKPVLPTQTTFSKPPPITPKEVETTVTIHIGRIEVHAVREQERPVNLPRTPVLSLSDYLKQQTERD